MKRFSFWFLLAASIACAQQASQQRRIAITIDDLPCAGGCRGLAEMQAITTQLLGSLEGVHTTAFVNESGLQVRNERDARVRLLEQWLEAGMDLGNHTYSHPSPNNIPVEAYQADVLKGQVVLRKLLPGRTKLYFRHPFTHTGPDPEYKERLESFLAKHGYEIAPFTVENSDYIWALVYRRALERNDTAGAERVCKEYVEHLNTALEFAEGVSRRLFGREIPQTLLIHANNLNARVMPQLLAMLGARGYKVVPLGEALADAAYRTPDRFTARFGPSWFERWGVELGVAKPMAGEPEVPAWVMDAYSRPAR